MASLMAHRSSSGGSLSGFCGALPRTDFVKSTAAARSSHQPSFHYAAALRGLPNFPAPSFRRKLLSGRYARLGADSAFHGLPVLIGLLPRHR
ncbi:hypothetical protein Mal15_56840 [Stieleria maiorica]|uniref:Uncharacterized protein n=1 Tax=Stieleria maiorica TaxID=2795974 RepID=A0A5B9MNV6_9BACT|nr:hypothetical protein Mal15_56840 [Stieleria maiorica]